MNLNYTSTILSIILLTLAHVGNANAVIIDYFITEHEDAHVDMGETQLKQSGTFVDFYKEYVSISNCSCSYITTMNDFFGSLHPMSKIIFVYSLNNIPRTFYNPGELGDDGGEIVPALRLSIYGRTPDGFNSDHAHAGYPIPGSKSFGNLVLATADLHGNTGITSIENRSNSQAEFRSVIQFFTDARLGAGSALHYYVAPLPLPASLPMFAAALMGLFIFKRRRQGSVWR